MNYVNDVIMAHGCYDIQVSYGHILGIAEIGLDNNFAVFLERQNKKIDIVTQNTLDRGIYYYDENSICFRQHEGEPISIISIELIKEKVNRWYGMNMNIKIDNITQPILIGMCNHKEYTDFIKNNTAILPKNILAYLNSSMNSSARFECYNTMNFKKFITSKVSAYSINDGRTNYQKNIDYFYDLASSKYSICSSGAGLDTFRFYESMCLLTIPIVLRCDFYEYYENNFPIMIVDDWDELTEQLLLEKYEKLFKRFHNKNVKEYLNSKTYYEFLKNNKLVN